jgi:hypothetical protein
MLRVNSFPRTANIFVSGFLQQFFTIEDKAYTPQTMHDLSLLDNKEVKQIVIIRNPKDCIPSFEILKKLSDEYCEEPILYAINEWIRWHEKVIENSDHLFLFSFEQIINNPVDCLVSVADINKIKYMPKYEMHNHHGRWVNAKTQLGPDDSIRSTSKNSKEYESKVYEYLNQDPEILERVELLYSKLKETISINQKLFGIKIKEMRKNE